jgi:hypothetical protein
MKQTTEDYNAIEKFIEKYPNHWPGYDLEQIKSDYEKKIKSFKN